jgi:hypothetical protein
MARPSPGRHRYPATARPYDCIGPTHSLMTARALFHAVSLVAARRRLLCADARLSPQTWNGGRQRRMRLAQDAAGSLYESASLPTTAVSGPARAVDLMATSFATTGAAQAAWGADTAFLSSFLVPAPGQAHASGRRRALQGVLHRPAHSGGGATSRSPRPRTLTLIRPRARARPSRTPPPLSALPLLGWCYNHPVPPSSPAPPTA